jgi:hypothetical protein
MSETTQLQVCSPFFFVIILTPFLTVVKSFDAAGWRSTLALSGWHRGDRGNCMCKAWVLGVFVRAYAYYHWTNILFLPCAFVFFFFFLILSDLVGLHSSTVLKNLISGAWISPMFLFSSTRGSVLYEGNRNTIGFQNFSIDIVLKIRLWVLEGITRIP